MLFRKRKKEPEQTFNLVDMLTERPDTIFACDKYMAVYSTVLDKVIWVSGDYSGLDEEEMNEVLIRRLRALQAQMN